MNYYPYSSPYGAQNRAQYGVPSYGGYNYNPQPQQMAQMPQNSPQVQPQYDAPIQDIRFVTTEEAKAFIVMPNSTVLLIDKASGRAQLKSADQMGQSASKFFRFEEINADGTPVKPQPEQPQPDYKDFVKLSELNTLGFATLDDIKKFGFVTYDQYASLEKKLDEIQSRLDRARPNGSKQTQ